MIELFLLSLSLISCKSQTGVTGFFGQDCTPSQGDFPQACPTIGQEIRNSNALKKIECKHNFDCCTCGKMICGPDCLELVCNGDSGCYGVRDIEIRGSLSSGAVINCNGDISCMNTGIYGINIAKILCSGDNSCSYSIFNLECLPSIGCILECVGDASCEADPSLTQLNGIYKIENSFGLTCSIQACRYSIFNLLTNIGGSILCTSFESCYESIITVTNINYLLCGGTSSCKNANILIINPQNGFSLLCQSNESCKNLKIDILITDPSIQSFNGIICGGTSSCESAIIKITKQSTKNNNNQLRITELTCGGNRACFNSIFELTSNIIVSSCRCAGGATNACNGLIGVASC